MKLHTALRKDHRCDLCGRRIPIGAKYWDSFNLANPDVHRKEHTNCLEFEREDLLDPGYNANRKLGKVTP